MLKHYLITFLISMVPLIELRGAIPYGLALELDPLFTYALAILGNCLPVPFILFFIKRILGWMQASRVRLFNRVATWVIEKGQRGFHKVQRYAVFGLFLFVAIPLPGTGAWTGALAAALLNMRMKYALPSIVAGVAIAGVIMTLASYGVVAAFEIFA